MAAQAPNQSTHKRQVVQSAVFAIAITFVFAATNYGISHTMLGRWSEFNVYQLLHAPLADFAPNNPVMVVDVSALPRDSNGQILRPNLENVLSQIYEDRDDEKEPAAVGLAIDFSPHLNKISSEEDQKFFTYCKDIRNGVHKNGGKRKKVPVYLGVSGTAYNPPAEWLGYTAFTSMAASIVVSPEDTHVAYRWFHDTTGDVYGKGVSLLSMGELLADSFRDPPKPPFADWCLESIPLNPSESRSPIVGGERRLLRIESGQGPQRAEGGRHAKVVEAGVSLLNTSKMGQIIGQTVAVEMRNGNPVVSGDFTNKIVIVGDAQSNDEYTWPGTVAVHRGVYLLACATYSYAEEPLYSFTEEARLGLDVLLSVALIVILAVVEQFTKGNNSHRAYRNAAHSVVLVAVLVTGLILVRLTGIMWFDFVSIVIALALHSKVEHIARELVAKVMVWRDAKRKAKQSEGSVPTKPDLLPTSGNSAAE